VFIGVHQWFKKFSPTMQIQSDQEVFKPDKRKKTISMKPINHNQSELVTLYTAPVVPPSAA